MVIMYIYQPQKLYNLPFLITPNNFSIAHSSLSFIFIVKYRRCVSNYGSICVSGIKRRSYFERRVCHSAPVSHKKT